MQDNTLPLQAQQQPHVNNVNKDLNHTMCLWLVKVLVAGGKMRHVFKVIG